VAHIKKKRRKGEGSRNFFKLVEREELDERKGVIAFAGLKKGKRPSPQIGEGENFKKLSPGRGEKGKKEHLLSRKGRKKEKKKVRKKNSSS